MRTLFVIALVLSLITSCTKKEKVQDLGGDTEITSAPVVFTNTVSQSNGLVITGGTVSWDGGTAITEVGVVYSKRHNPRLSTAKDSLTKDQLINFKQFTSTLTGLQAGETYYICAYAKNATNTGYGQEVAVTIFSTPLTLNLPLGVILKQTSAWSIPAQGTDTIWYDTFDKMSDKSGIMVGVAPYQLIAGKPTYNAIIAPYDGLYAFNTTFFVEPATVNGDASSFYVLGLRVNQSPIVSKIFAINQGLASISTTIHLKKGDKVQTLVANTGAYLISYYCGDCIRFKGYLVQRDGFETD